MEESKQNEIFTVIDDLNVVQKKSCVVTFLFSAYFIWVYVSFINVKNCGFENGICNFNNIFSIIKQL